MKHCFKTYSEQKTRWEEGIGGGDLYLHKLNVSLKYGDTGYTKSGNVEFRLISSKADAYNSLEEALYQCGYRDNTSYKLSETHYFLGQSTIRFCWSSPFVVLQDGQYVRQNFGATVVEMNADEIKQYVYGKLDSLINDKIIKIN